MTVDGRFREGLALFNRGEYFECHDVIEELWLETPPTDPHRDLYKGVIQAAAAIYQFDRGILTGARGLYRTSLEHLEKYRPSALGVNVEKLVSEMKLCFLPFEGWDGKSPLRRRGDVSPRVEWGQGS